MKADIHPTYFTNAAVTCACGNTFTTGSTKKEIHIEICSSCHPFFTGQEKTLDAAGRVERFKSRTAAKKPDLKKKSVVKAEKKAKRAARGPKVEAK
jgi:large subunit ribosomal protein L31